MSILTVTDTKATCPSQLNAEQISNHGDYTDGDGYDDSTSQKNNIQITFFLMNN